ncbi:MAG: 2-hydroxychromene-2-carboxylate isomerase [Pseudomonadota bacterium]
MARIEFFYDLTSPWTYLAYTGVQPIVRKYQADIEWRPILVGGVFNAVNQELYAKREAAFSNERQLKHMLKDLADWAALRQIELRWPEFHPASAVKCMRGCFVAEAAGKLLDYNLAVFEAYWGRCEDVSQDSVLMDIVDGLGLNPDTFLEDIQAQPVKDRLRANTDELITRGGFGSPTIFVNGDDMYFGNDRLPLLEAALSRLSR